MGRTESKSMQVHPNDEQSTINLMEKFHWSLLNSQTIDYKDSHQEVEGDTLYSVTESKNYVKLQFTRDVELPNLQSIKKLEKEYFALPKPEFPGLFPGAIWMWLVGAVVYGIGIVAWVVYFFAMYKPKKEEADNVYANLKKRRSEIMQELGKFN